MGKFHYQKMFDLKPDKTEYRALSGKFVAAKKCGKETLLCVKPQALTLLAREAFSDLAFFLRPAFLEQLSAILNDKTASANDRFVAEALLKNAAIAAEGVLPLCQDTGTANIIGYRGNGVLTDGRDDAALSKGVFETYAEKNLRYSQMAPLSLFEETNTGCNLPAQIDISAAEGMEYRFLFMAKGGGSSNKTALFVETAARLNEASLVPFLREKIKGLGVAACPPYRIAVVIGGTSPEMALKTVKLASANYLDTLPTRGNKYGTAFRDLEWEKRVLAIAEETGLGAQFCGKWLAHEARVIRLPRHAASCFIGIGVSCNADRNIKGKITSKGIFLEKLEKNPSRFLKNVKSALPAKPIPVDLNRPMPEILKQLSGKPVGTLVALSGALIVARDIAHARLKKALDDKGTVPDYFKDHPIYYAGPAKTPKGSPSGSFGPTTAARMDSYLPEFMKKGASPVTLAKGNRAPLVTEACKTYGGFYLGTIGGAAALVARENITSSEVVDFEELGMEAVRKIIVKDLPAFILSDNQGNNLYA